MKVDVQKILAYRDQCKQVEKICKVVNYTIEYKSDFNWLLEELGIEGKIFGGNFFVTPNPFLIHVDTGKLEELNNKKSLYNIVVPLNSKEDFKTIIFNQKYYGEATHFYVGNAYNYYPTPVYNNVKRDYDDVQGLETNLMEPIEYVKYLSHLPYETVKNLSIKNIVSWEVGDAFFFESQYLHCSCNFNGIKEGLTLLVSEL